MNPHLITVYLLIEANEHLQGQVAEALHGVFTDGMRTSVGTDSPSIDWAITGDGIPSSIAQIPPLLDEHAPDRTAFPTGHGGRSDVDHASTSDTARTHGKDAS